MSFDIVSGSGLIRTILKFTARKLCAVCGQPQVQCPSVAACLERIAPPGPRPKCPLCATELAETNYSRHIGRCIIAFNATLREMRSDHVAFQPVPVPRPVTVGHESRSRTRRAGRSQAECPAPRTRKSAAAPPAKAASTQAPSGTRTIGTQTPRLELCPDARYKFVRWTEPFRVDEMLGPIGTEPLLPLPGRVRFDDLMDVEDGPVPEAAPVDASEWGQIIAELDPYAPTFRETAGPATSTADPSSDGTEVTAAPVHEEPANPKKQSLMTAGGDGDDEPPTVDATTTPDEPPVGYQRLVGRGGLRGRRRVSVVFPMPYSGAGLRDGKRPTGSPASATEDTDNGENTAGSNGDNELPTAGASSTIDVDDEQPMANALPADASAQSSTTTPRFTGNIDGKDTAGNNGDDEATGETEEDPVAPRTTEPNIDGNVNDGRARGETGETKRGCMITVRQLMAEPDLHAISEGDSSASAPEENTNRSNDSPAPSKTGTSPIPLGTTSCSSSSSSSYKEDNGPLATRSVRLRNFLSRQEFRSRTRKVPRRSGEKKK